MVDVNNALFDDYVEFLKTENTGQSYRWAATTMTVNLDGLMDNMVQHDCARLALDIWSRTAGLQFVEVSTGANITFDNEDAGAYCSNTYGSGLISAATVNVQKTWDDNMGYAPWSTGGYGLQTFLHEIGHALGLNHGGPYNGSADYATDAIFAIDTWQYSIMSYFAQDAYTANDASYAFLCSPMIADIKAIRDLYGTLEANPGDTVYGKGETALAGITDFGIHADAAFCINDTGGKDRLDLSNLNIGSHIDLAPGSFSDLNGLIGNVSIALGTIIEDALGTSQDDFIDGNQVANILKGLDGADTIRGFGGNDSIVGGAGNDSLAGGDGNDILSGGAGADALDGGSGLDTASYAYALAGVTVSMIHPWTSLGEALGDSFAGIENLLGSSFDDTLVGDDQANILDGGLGQDRLVGAGGDDIYRLGASSDSIKDTTGIDTIRSTISRSLLKYAGIENLTLDGIEAANATGNALANILRGNAAANVLDGGAGQDRLYGGAGNDTYVLAEGSDSVTDSAGTDTIRSTISRSLRSYASIENLRFDGSGNVNGTGNNLANSMTGNSGANRLDGSLGSDTLTGGAGKDSFVFSAAPGANNVDVIRDFSVKDDTIRLSSTVFTALSAGWLATEAFQKNMSGHAQDVSDRVIYESDTGKLFYDRNGTLDGGSVQFATLTKNLALTSLDFLII